MLASFQDWRSTLKWQLKLRGILVLMEQDSYAHAKPNMTKKPFHSLAQRLGVEQFKQKANGIFCRDFDSEWSGCIIVQGALSYTLHSAGVINQSVNKMMYKALEEADSQKPNKIKPVRYGPILCSVSATVLATHAWREKKSLPLSWQENENPAAAFNEENLVRFAVDYALPFIESNLSLDAALRTAYLYNKFVQAQRYSLPVALLKMDRINEFKKYVDEWLSICPSDDEKELYRNFVSRLLQKYEG